MLEHLTIDLVPGKKIFFASDFHLGSPDHSSSIERERRIVRWLDGIQDEAAAIFLVGDIFDFWFEYKRAVPKGFVRILGKLAELSDRGIPVHVFTGNHDIWMFGYFQEELNIPVHKDKVLISAAGKKIFVAHGDGRGPKDILFKLLKKIFRNRFCQWLFSLVHPDIGIGIARAWSERNKKKQRYKGFYGLDKEWLVLYAKRQLETEHIDYFVFGHRHYPVEARINEKCTYYNIGDWITYNSFGEFDGEAFFLRSYEE